MADLGELDRAGAVKIAGAPSTGIEDNYLEVDANGYIGTRIYTASGSAVNFGQAVMASSIPVVIASDQSAIPVSQSGTWTVQPGNTANTTAWFVKDNSLGTVAAGTAGTQSSLAGGVFNTALPTLTNGQQSAIQVDSSGRILISPSVQGALAEDHNYGTVGATTLRTASQIGNATGAAAFGAGTTSAQVLRVVLPTDQTAIPASQSGTWTIQPGNTANTTPWLVTDSSDGPVTPGTVAAKSSLSGGQFNTALPTLTTGQQSALQVDSSGRLIISPSSSSSVVTVSNLPTTVDTNYGTVGASTIRSAAQIGNATGAADFNAGATGAQTLRTSANQGTPGTAANAWFEKITDGTNVSTVKAASTAAVATDTALVVAISPNNTVAVTQSTSPWITKDQSDGPVTPGAVASFSQLIGGQFNTTLPTLTNTQQSALQLDSNGRLITIEDLSDVKPATINITIVDSATTTNAIANGQSSFTGTPTVGSAASFVVDSLDTVVIEVTGVWTGTLQIETSMDGGTVWYIRPIHQAGGSSATSFGSFTANFAGGCNVGGWTNIRVRAIAAMTGTATVRVVESINPNSVYVANAIRLIDSNGDQANITPNNDLQVADISNISGVYGNKTVTTSAAAVRVGGSNLANRKVITILNNGNKTIYWGFDSSVTTSNGTPLVAAQQGTWNIGASITIFMISSSGSQDVRVAEMS